MSNSSRPPIRLQKVLAQAGIASRRKAEEMIGAGRVQVDGRPAAVGCKVNPASVRITVDGKPIGGVERKVVYLLYKPAGFVTTASDPQGRKTVLDLMKDVSVRLFPVGRLDYNTEGLLLLTNDGDLAHALMHPSRKVKKTYAVNVRGHLASSAVQQLSQGVQLDDGRTAPAKVQNVRHTGKGTAFELEIHEGRNRQVRRMCDAVGHPVTSLKRIRLGFLTLNGLRCGQSRQLKDWEIRQLRSL